MDRTESDQRAAIGLLRHRFAGAVCRWAGKPGAAPTGRRGRYHQYRPKRRDEGFDHRLGGRHPASPGRRHLRHEFQEYAGIRLELGLSLCPGADGRHRAAAADLVQMEGLDLASSDDALDINAAIYTIS